MKYLQRMKHRKKFCSFNRLLGQFHKYLSMARPTHKLLQLSFESHKIAAYENISDVTTTRFIVI